MKDARESNKFITQNNYTIDNENVGYTLRTKVFGTKDQRYREVVIQR